MRVDGFAGRYQHARDAAGHGGLDVHRAVACSVAFALRAQRARIGDGDAVLVRDESDGFFIGIDGADAAIGAADVVITAGAIGDEQGEHAGHGLAEIDGEGAAVDVRDVAVVLALQGDAAECAVDFDFQYELRSFAEPLCERVLLPGRLRAAG